MFSVCYCTEGSDSELGHEDMRCSLSVCYCTEGSDSELGHEDMRCSLSVTVLKDRTVS